MTVGFFFIYTPECFSPQWNTRQKVIFKPRKGYLSLSLSPSLPRCFSLFFKWDQPAISEQCKWVLPIHSSVICHKSQGLGEDFEMLIQLRMVTSLRTFKKKKKYSWSEVLCALESCEGCLSPSLLLPPPTPQLSEMSKLNMKFRLALTASKVGAFSFFFPKSIRSERGFKKNLSPQSLWGWIFPRLKIIQTKSPYRWKSVTSWIGEPRPELVYSSNAAVALCFQTCNFIYLENLTFRRGVNWICLAIIIHDFLDGLVCHWE